jgi:hypothetical protein
MAKKRGANKQANGGDVTHTGSPTNKENDNAPVDVIPYDDALPKGKVLVAKLDELDAKKRELDGQEVHVQLELGELVDRLEPKYGDRTLAKYAKEIGKAKCTLERYRDVYRDWKGKLAPGPTLPSYTVLRTLQTHPDREAIITENPKLTKSQANKKMEELWAADPGLKKGKKKKTQGPLTDPEETEAWVNVLLGRAQDIGHELALERNQEAFRKHADPAAVQGVVDALRELADALEQGIQVETTRPSKGNGRVRRVARKEAGEAAQA